jgi:hypothetical protein
VAAGSLSYVISRDEADPAGFSSSNRRLVTAWLDGTDLKYRIQAPLAAPAAGWESGSTQVLASGVTGMSCRGLGRDGAPATDPAAVAIVACDVDGAVGLRERLLVRLRPNGGVAP